MMLLLLFYLNNTVMYTPARSFDKIRPSIRWPYHHTCRIFLSWFHVVFKRCPSFRKTHVRAGTHCVHIETFLNSFRFVRFVLPLVLLFHICSFFRSMIVTSCSNVINYHFSNCAHICLPQIVPQTELNGVHKLFKNKKKHLLSFLSLSTHKHSYHFASKRTYK